MSIMNGKYRKAGFLTGFTLIALIWGALCYPSLMLQWNHHYYHEIYRNQQYQKACLLLPSIDDLSNPVLHLEYQDYMIQAGKKNFLEESYRNLVVKNLKNPTAFALAARVVEDPSESARFYAKALALSPDDLTVIILQIEKALNKGNALSVQPLLAKLPENTWLRFCCEARMYQLMGERDKALAAYNLTVSMNPPLWISNLYAEFLAESEHFSGNPYSFWKPGEIRNDPLASAYQIILQQVEIASRLESLPLPALYYPQALTALARAALHQQDINSARVLLHRASLMNPDLPDLIYYMGKENLLEGNKRGAEILFSKGLNATRDRAMPDPFHYRMGYLLWLEGNELARDHYLKALHDLPDNGILLRQSGFTHLTKGNYEDCIHDLSRAAQLFPKDKQISSGLVSSYLVLNQKDQAIKVLVDSLDKDFNNIPFLDQLTDLYIEKGEPDRAITLYNSFEVKYPNSGIPYLRVANIYIKKGDKAKAKAILENCLQTKSNIDNRAEIEKLLELVTHVTQ